MRKNLLNIAINIAKEKLNIHPEYNNYPHYTFIVQDNKIIGYGLNMSGEPPKSYGYQKRLNNGIAKMHSEFVAYKKMKAILHNKPFEIINIRLNKKGELKLCHFSL